MTANVIAWPPVGAVGVEWTELAPTQVSRSMVTGSERVTAFQRKRRLASVEVAAVGRSVFDAGYMEMLKRLLEGTKLVRLHSYPINWYLGQEKPRQMTGNVVNMNGFTNIVVAGFTPFEVVMKPAEFILVKSASVDNTALTPLSWETPDGPLSWSNDLNTNTESLTWFTGGQNTYTVQSITAAKADDTGTAYIPVVETLPDETDAEVTLRASASGVFRPVDYPRAVQPLTGNWTYQWAFREVFADEVGGFREINPWGH